MPKNLEVLVKAQGPFKLFNRENRVMGQNAFEKHGGSSYIEQLIWTDLRLSPGNVSCLDSQLSAT